MGSPRVQTVCLALGVIGLIGVIVCCAVPRWSVFKDFGTVKKTTILEGLWMTCELQSTGLQQCRAFDVWIDPSLQASRAMTITSCLLSGLSLLMLFYTASFTTCMENKDAKRKNSQVAKVGLLLAGLLIIIAVSLFTFQALVFGRMHMLGECIYVGWASGLLLLLAGGLLCCFNRPDGSSREDARCYTTTVYCNVPAPMNKLHVA
ncbi:claudin-4-like [Parambassis ranga]|uniref:Claudin n=1 Tax=Parambassis ranga TaxID=210632 RepID=A0A6P7IV10_9TELE|nr:claudin-4-like [Parambassis ranga]